jgi:EAL domain-containing protein (putative c-di-GMP-specific phosphodiesterase class I)
VSVDASQLVMEITENLLVDEDEPALRHLAEFRSAGIRVAIDGFGTGSTSMCYLHQPAFGIVKIDRRFIQNIVATWQIAESTASAGLARARSPSFFGAIIT